MKIFARARGRRVFLLCAPLVAGVVLAPASASAGFLDQLFGGGAAPSQPSFSFEPRSYQPPEFQYQPIERHQRQQKKVAVQDAPSGRQQTTDLWHDKTLRPGDAIMMKDGMHIFRGPSASLHMAKEFVPVSHARVPSTKRAALYALDTTRNDPLRYGHAPDTLASGRSAAVSAPVTEGIKITDARGASVRYVGP